MKAVIEVAFPICTINGCIEEHNHENIYIQDQTGSKCIVTYNPSIAHFTVYNPQLKTITFIAIDHCIWGDGSGHEKCDFAVSDSATIAFIEIKDTSNRSSAHKKKAKAQLEVTIQNFDSQINLNHLVRKAVICWKYGTTHPAAKTAMQSAAVHFFNTYNVELLEGNSTTL